MKPLSEDLRQRIVRACEAGEGTGEVCRRFGVSRSSAERFWNQYRRRGHCRPKQIGGCRRSRLAEHERKVRAWIAAQPDLTLAQLQTRCREQLGVRLGLNALWHRLERLGLSYKKNDARRRARSNPTLKRPGTSGARISPAGTADGWSSSTRPA